MTTPLLRVAAPLAALLLAAACATPASHTSAVWPADLREHVTAVGPSGLGAVEIRTDLDGDTDTAVRVCEVARRQHPGDTVTVMGAAGLPLAGSSSGQCAPVE